jgi:hypothetical protein
MALDPHSYLLAVRHNIPRAQSDVHGTEQARRALAAELADLKEFTVRARALMALVHAVNPDAAKRVHGRATHLSTHLLADLATGETGLKEHLDGELPAHGREAQGGKTRSNSKRSGGSKHHRKRR